MTAPSSIRRVPVVAPLLALALVVMACGETTSHGADDPKCGTAEAANTCMSARWPRLAVTFGDTGATSLSYAFVVDGQAFPLNINQCVGERGESPAVHCDVGFAGYPAQHAQGRLLVSATAGGPMQLALDITLRPFNYCGNGLAQIVVSAGDGGTPTASPVTYVDACSP